MGDWRATVNDRSHLILDSFARQFGDGKIGFRTEKCRVGVTQQWRYKALGEEGMVVTKRIDGKARADRLVADVAAAAAKLKAEAGIAPGLMRRPRRRGSGKPGLCPQQGQGGDRRRHRELSGEIAGDNQRSRAAGADRQAQCRRPGRRHPCAAAAAKAHRSAARHRRNRSAARTWTASMRRMSDSCGAVGAQGAGPVHALWLPAAAARCHCRLWPAPKRSCSAAPTSSASRWRLCSWPRIAR